MKTSQLQGHRATPDLADAWRAARDQIRAAGIDLRRTPLFLALGQPAGGLSHFFPSEAGWPLLANDDASPLAACGSRDGLFICLKDNSLLGAVSGRYRKVGEPSTPLAPAADTATDTAADGPTAAYIDAFSASAFSALALGGAADESDAFLSALQQCHAVSALATDTQHSAAGDADWFPAGSPAAVGSDPGGTATLAKPRTIIASMATGSASATASAMELRLCELERQLAEAEGTAADSAAAGLRVVDESAELQLAECAPSPRVVAEPMPPQTADQAIASLRTICRMISADREPFCPLNGIVLLIPIDATADAARAALFTNSIRRDLETVAHSMQTAASVQVVLCDMESCEGGDELLDRLAPSEFESPLGLSLPAVPDGEEGGLQRLADRTSWWICEELLPAVARRAYRRQWNEDSTPAAADTVHQAGNRRLAGLVQAMRARRPLLARLLSDGLASTAGQLRLRGCYLGFGGDTPSGRAFAAGILPRIYAMQHEVRWLESRRRRDRHYLAGTVLGYATLVAAAALTAAVVTA